VGGGSLLQSKNAPYDSTGAPSGKCSHAKVAREAAALAQNQVDKAAAADVQPVRRAAATGTFDYCTFYEMELDKKHKDK
jgi:hypothetical protein